jgi:FkbM family methyltransferase
MAGAKGLGILNYKSPYQSGEEPFLKRFLRNYDQPSSIVLDIGANKGEFASWVIGSSKNLNVISFEPNPVAASTLQKDISEVNSRHTTIAKGASAAAGQSTLYDYDEINGSGHASLYSEVFTQIHHSENTSKITVELTTIDIEIENINGDVCLLKIDTEGHEQEVLLGSMLFIKNNPPPAILIEFNEMNAISGTHYHRLKSLIGNAYDAYRLLPGGRLLPLKNLPPLFTEIYAYQNIVFIRSDIESIP